MEKKTKNIFMQGAVPEGFIGDSIGKHSKNQSIGAYSLFLGQVRADVLQVKTVAAFEYTTYQELPRKRCMKIRENIFQKYTLTCMHVYHSLGRVRAGEICLFVFTSSKHRKMAIDACEETVERIKAELPVWVKNCLMMKPINGK